MYPARVFVRLAFGLAIAALLTTGAARAQAPDLPLQEPQLRIDAGMHTAVINRVAVNAACTRIVTASDDKTARLWSLLDGRLLHTLRPPVGPGFEGRVFAVAMAPDASWVAAAGWNRGGRDHWVYIFQAATGAVITRLGPLDDVILHMAVSRDGRFLAATLGSGRGLRVWERTGPEAWRMAAEDADYDGAESYGADFSRTGVLYTTTFDGKLRRYAPPYKGKPLVAKARGGQRPYAVAVHPAGDRVAVGFEDTTAVEIYHAATLAFRDAADTSSAVYGNLSAVSWSTDGKRLYAGGRYIKDRRTRLLAWNEAGRNPVDNTLGPRTTIQDLQPCGGDIAVGASDPAFGLIAADGSRRIWQENVQADMRGKRQAHFTVSRDGRRVRFGFQEWSEDPVVFDLAAERLSDAPQNPTDLFQADTESLDIKNWINYVNPTVDGTPLLLDRYETARSLAIAPDKQSFVLGGDWTLRAYAKDGTLLWRKEGPGTAWGVNIPRDGGVAIAAYSDGTIRWHRLSDGQELLAVFVHAKDRRWVAWTPKGYYTASSGGEGLIGWHVNRGWTDAADFFPAYRYRNQLYRTDIVGRILGDLDEDTAIRQANLRADTSRDPVAVRDQLPPVVTILSPLEGTSPISDNVTVEYTLRSPASLPITGVSVLVNGSIVATDRGTGALDPGDELKRRVTFKVPIGGELTITLVAKAGDKASEPATVTLRPAAGRAVPLARPTLYALVIGVTDYRKEGLNLPAASKDAAQFADQLRKQKGRAFKDVVLFQDKVLVDKDATQQAIIEGVEWLKKVASGNDLALVYFSGHGTTKGAQASYLVPYDYDLTKNSTLLDKGRLLNLLDDISAKVLLFLDVCQASDGLLRPLEAKFALGQVEFPESHIMAFASSLADSSRADRFLSYFTRALIEGFEGKIPGKRVITPPDLDHWLLQRVRELSDKKQLPATFSPKGQNAKYFVDLTLAVVQ